MNNVSIIGRLTKEIEIKKTESGKKVTSFTLAVNRDKDHTDFIPCVAWEKTAELLERYTSKGSRIGAVGQISTRSYETQSGTRYVTEVLVSRIELLDSKKENRNQYTPQYDEVDIDSGDLPF